MELLKYSVIGGISYLLLKKMFSRFLNKTILIENVLNYYHKSKKWFAQFKLNKSKRFTVINNGDEIMNLDLQCNNKAQNVQFFELLAIKQVKYDYILYIDDKNYIRYNNLTEIPEITKIPNNISYSLCNYVFLQINLFYDDKKYQLDLKTKNFYIKDNILFDKIFLKYYCKYFLKFEFDENKEYNLVILDNNCTKLEVNKNFYIKLLEDNYELIEVKNSKLEHIESIEMDEDDNFDLYINQNERISWNYSWKWWLSLISKRI